MAEAVESGSAARVGEMLARGVPANIRFDTGDVPLLRAARRNFTEVIRCLLKAGAEVDAQDSEDRGGETALMFAADRGSFEAVEILLDAGADVNLKSVRAATALSRAAMGSTRVHARIVRRLIEAGADVDRGASLTPLMLACGSATAESVEALIRGGAEVNIRTNEGTPLTEAVVAGNADAVTVLLNAGADPSLTIPNEHPDHDIAGRTPLELARAARHRRIVSLLRSATPGSTNGKIASVADSWQRIESHLTAEVRATLHSGAALPEIAAVERRLAVTLPDDLRASLRLHNGQSGQAGLIPSLVGAEAKFCLLSLDRIVGEWILWNELLESGDFRGLDAGPDRGVRDAWWHPAWIPVSASAAGDHHCVDLAPAPGGSCGQVITVNHDNPRRQRVAVSFGGWLNDIVDMLAAS